MAAHCGTLFCLADLGVAMRSLSERIRLMVAMNSFIVSVKMLSCVFAGIASCFGLVDCLSDRPSETILVYRSLRPGTFK